MAGVEGGNKCMDPQSAVSLSSVIERYNTHLPQGCSEEMARIVRRDPTAWNKLDPRRLETFVADIFKYNYNDAEVIHVSGPGDRGIDVVFIESSGRKWLMSILDQLIEAELLSKATAAAKLEHLIEQDSLYPMNECQKRLEQSKSKG